jgi:heme/copper-type cytochrome/quinol oxidase subunit 3
VGTLFASGAAVMLFAGLIGTYLSVTAESGLPENVTIPLTPPNMAAVTLLMSVVTVHWAFYAIGNDDRVNTYVALGLTLVFGLAYINVAVFLYTQMGAAIAGSAAELLIYALSGAHLALTIGSMIFVALMAFRTLGGQYSGRDREGLAAAVVLWDTMVGIYLVIWYAVYITK